MTENVSCQLKLLLVPKALGGIKQDVLFYVVCMYVLCLYVFVCISHCSLNRFLLFLSGMKL